jgi:Ca-activated chloride channel family protein
MKYTHLVFRLVALLLAVSAGVTRSQAQAADTDASTAPKVSYVASVSAGTDDQQTGVITLHKRVDEVNLLFIATDKHGKFVRDLAQSDFTILDDHKPPQAIFNFRRETDLPLDLGLLIDVSGSVNSRFDFEQTAATSFLQHTIRAGFDRAFVVGFNSQTQLVQDFTDNVQSLSVGVHKLHDGGGTALYDAIYRISKEKLLK